MATWSEARRWAEAGTPLRWLGFARSRDAATAAQYLESGRCFWNSGIFVWKAQTIIDALRRHEPRMAGHLDAIARAAGTGQADAVLRAEFEAIVGKSIDYAVMERHEDIVMLEAPFTWDDVGSWQATSRMQGADADGNTLQGRCLPVRTSGSIVRTDDEHLIVTLGVQDLIVVRTPDATLVAHKDDEESIREVVEQLKQRGWSDLL